MSLVSTHGYSGSVVLGWTLGNYIFNNLFAWFWCTKKENSSLRWLELKKTPQYDYSERRPGHYEFVDRPMNLCKIRFQKLGPPVPNFTYLQCLEIHLNLWNLHGQKARMAFKKKSAEKYQEWAGQPTYKYELSLWSTTALLIHCGVNWVFIIGPPCYALHLVIKPMLTWSLDMFGMVVV